MKGEGAWHRCQIQIPHRDLGKAPGGSDHGSAFIIFVHLLLIVFIDPQ